MRVVISIPAYNEEKTIGKVIEDIKKIMDHTKYEYKILVIDDGSKDNTSKIAKEKGAIVYSHPVNAGLAQTFKTEIEKCLDLKADIIVHTDADGQYLAKEIPKLIEKVEEGYDLVLGSRFKRKIEHMPWIKKIGNKAFSKVISNIVRTKITDAQTGFRAFTKTIAQKIKITSTFSYTQEQIIRAFQAKFKVTEIPVYFAKRGAKTKSRLMKGPFDYALKAGINLLRIYRDYKPLKFFGMFGLLFMFIGFLIAIILLSRFFILGFPGGFWDKYVPSLILVAIFIMGGLQLIFFGLLADKEK